jgi:hypothetical protein
MSIPEIAEALEISPRSADRHWHFARACGARVVIEGPADFQFISASEVSCSGGRLTAEVPPQARGFRIGTPQMNVTDLGTSFGLDVKEGRTELHVFKGSVEFQSGEYESLTLATWVRVQGLDRQINSLFMSDGFEAGTVHWSVRHDGVLALTAIGSELESGEEKHSLSNHCRLKIHEN